MNGHTGENLQVVQVFGRTGNDDCVTDDKVTKVKGLTWCQISGTLLSTLSSSDSGLLPNWLVCHNAPSSLVSGVSRELRYCCGRIKACVDEYDTASELPEVSFSTLGQCGQIHLFLCLIVLSALSSHAFSLSLSHTHWLPSASILIDKLFILLNCKCTQEL